VNTPYHFLVELAAGPDPQARYGHPARDGVYRLRLLLKVLDRAFRLKAVTIKPADNDGKVMPDGANPEPATPRDIRVLDSHDMWPMYSGCYSPTEPRYRLEGGRE
jgi:hypothetical protein